MTATYDDAIRVHLFASERAKYDRRRSSVGTGLQTCEALHEEGLKGSARQISSLELLD